MIGLLIAISVICRSYFTIFRVLYYYLAAKPKTVLASGVGLPLSSLGPWRGVKWIFKWINESYYYYCNKWINE